MKRKYTVRKTFYSVSEIAHVFRWAISSVCLIVLLVSPIAPAFASEINGEAPPVVVESAAPQQAVEVSEPPEVDLRVEEDMQGDESQSEALDGNEAKSTSEEIDVPEHLMETVVAEDVTDEDMITESSLQIPTSTDVDIGGSNAGNFRTSEDQIDESKSITEDIDNLDTSLSEDTPLATESSSSSAHSSTEIASSSTPVIESNGDTNSDSDDTVSVPGSSSSDTEIGVDSNTTTDINDIAIHTDATTTKDTSAEAENDYKEKIDDTVGVAEVTSEIVEPEITGPVVTSFVTNDLNRYNFGIDDCLPVGDGSFYCSDAKKSKVVLEDAVLSAPDEDGDMEIYIRKAGVDHKITNNTEDDQSPFYDALSERIVWHRLINDRYQIISYDLKTGEETQLTHETYNNMEPTAYGGATVWQAWVDNNWEIVLIDDAGIVRLTTNEVHDIAPHIRGEYIMWQTQSQSEWFVSVYNRKDKTTELIEGGDNGQAENPRFVLVYDSKKENGDIETIGYDLDRKQRIFLGGAPTPVPENIPEPEQTGEVRALINGKPPTEDDIVIVTGSGSNDPPAPPVPPISTGTTTDSLTTNVPATSTVPTLEIPQYSENATSTSTAEATEFDLIVETDATSTVPTLEIPQYFENATSTNNTTELIVPTVNDATTIVTTTDHIDDVVIPSLNTDNT